MPAIKALNFTLRSLTMFQQLLQRWALHLVIALVVVSMFSHIRHLYKIQQIRSAAGRVQGAVVQIESSQRLFVITADPEALRKYSFYRKILGQRLLVLCHLIPPSPRNENLCRETNALIAAKLDEMAETIRLVRAGNKAAADELVKTGIGVRYTDEIERHLDLIRIEETGGGVTHVACLVP